jgi:hypothetical protein
MVFSGVEMGEFGWIGGSCDGIYWSRVGVMWLDRWQL